MLGCIFGQTQMIIFILLWHVIFFLAGSIARFEFRLVLFPEFDAGLWAFAKPQTLTPGFLQVDERAEAFQSILELSENVFFNVCFTGESH